MKEVDDRKEETVHIKETSFSEVQENIRKAQLNLKEIIQGIDNGKRK